MIENEMPDEKKDQIENAEDGSKSFPVGSELLLLGILLLFVFGVGYAHQYLLLSKIDEHPTQNHTETQPPSKEVGVNDTENPFETIELHAESAFVWDVKTRHVFYMKAPDETHPLASVTKLMTALLAFELLEKNESIPITASAIGQEGNSNFLIDETFTFEDIVDLTLITSSNDGAFAIAGAGGALIDNRQPNEIFVEAMNLRADELGFTSMHFNNPTGLDISQSTSGGYGSARDVAFLFEHLLVQYPELLEKTKENYTRIYNQQGEYHEAENTNPNVMRITGLIGSKTGYTDLAGGNLALAFNAGLDRPVIVVVLGSGKSERFTDAISLVDATRNYLSH